MTHILNALWTSVLSTALRRLLGLATQEWSELIGVIRTLDKVTTRTPAQKHASAEAYIANEYPFIPPYLRRRIVQAAVIYVRIVDWHEDTPF